MKKNPERTHRLNINLTPEEYTKIEKEWKSSLCKHLGVYARDVLFSRPIIKTVRNRSLDDCMEQAIQLKRELNSVHNTFSQHLQGIHGLHQNSEFKNWLIAYTLEKEILFNKIDEVKKIIQKMAESWLQ